uniref:Cytochrome b5 heme-binding domain-containing protein n=1 Tax=Paramoeba aestuarina TaxID=180227 RepID=A0A7S4NB43_9EUKA
MGEGDKKHVFVTRINGKVYGLDDFMERHPGGRDMIALAQNRDSTGMFYSYHKNPAVAEKILAKLPVLDDSLVPPAPEIDRFDFNSKIYNDLRTLVNDYFTKNNLSSRGGLYMLTKSVLLVVFYSFIYSLSVWGWGEEGGSVFSRSLLCPLLGVLSASMGLCVQHDANHGALSSYPIVNRMFGFCDDVIGGSGLMWRHQHCVGHHVFCNDVENDNDTKSQYPLMKMNPSLPHRAYLRFQHIYFPFLYSLLGVSYPVGDAANYASGSYAGEIKLHDLSVTDRAIFLSGKALHVSLYFLIPIYFLGWYTWFLQWYLPTQLMGGLWLASVFAVSHNNTLCEHNCTSTDWANLQIRTSANWSSDSLMWNILSGGLNCQIEHHLFPGICHVHYPALSKIVRKYCQEHQIPYNGVPTFTEIYLDHINFLKKMGSGKKVD